MPKTAKKLCNKYRYHIADASKTMRHKIAMVNVYTKGMRYFTPIHIEELNRKVYFNPSTFEPTVENLRRMANGSAPIGVDGVPVTLHHIGQRHTSNLAMLTDTFHKQCDELIHKLPPSKGEQVNRNKFKREKRAIWMSIFDWLGIDVRG